jgi:hypothetical protein
MSTAPTALVVQGGVARTVTGKTFAATFGLVDSQEKALLRVWLEGLHTAGLEAKVRGGKAGFQVTTMFEDRCAPLTEIVTLVRRNGSLEQQSRKLVRAKDAQITQREAPAGMFGGCHPLGRRPEGLHEPRFDKDIAGYFARAAYLEAASIPAFERMACELEYFGGPSALVQRAIGAAEEEKRHAELMTHFARQFGGAAPPLAIPQHAKRSIEAFATENATEGCVFECYAAAVAVFQAAHAEDADLRTAMDQIARDECAHAALAFDVHRWALTQLDNAARARVLATQETALGRLFASTDLQTLHTASSRWVGEPSSLAARTLVEAVAACVAEERRQRA